MEPTAVACVLTLLLLAVGLPYSFQLINPASSVQQPHSNSVSLISSSPPLAFWGKRFRMDPSSTSASKFHRDAPDGGEGSGSRLAPNGGAYISIKDPHQPGLFSPLLPLARALYFPPPEIPRPDFSAWADAPLAKRPEPSELNALSQHRSSNSIVTEKKRQLISLPPRFKFTVRNLGRIVDQTTLLVLKHPRFPGARSKLDPEIESSSESPKKISKITPETTSSNSREETTINTTPTLTTAREETDAAEKDVSTLGTARWSRRRRFSREDKAGEPVGTVATPSETTPNNTAQLTQSKVLDADSTSHVVKPPSLASSADLPLRETSHPFGGDSSGAVAVPASPIVVEASGYEVNLEVALTPLPSLGAVDTSSSPSLPPPPQSSTSNCSHQIIYLPPPLPSSLSRLLPLGQTGHPSVPSPSTGVASESGTPIGPQSGCAYSVPPSESLTAQPPPPSYAVPTPVTEPVHRPAPPIPAPDESNAPVSASIGYESSVPSPTESPPPQSSFPVSSAPTPVAAPLNPPVPSPTPSAPPLAASPTSIVVEPSLSEDITGSRYHSPAAAPTAELPPTQPPQPPPSPAPAPAPSPPTAILPPFPPPSETAETSSESNPANVVGSQFTAASSEYESVNSEHGTSSNEGSAEEHVGRQGAPVPLNGHEAQSLRHENHLSSLPSNVVGGRVPAPSATPAPISAPEVNVVPGNVRNDESQYGRQTQPPAPIAPRPSPPALPQPQSSQLPQAVPLPLPSSYVKQEVYHQVSEYDRIEKSHVATPAPYIPQPRLPSSAVPALAPVAQPTPTPQHEYNVRPVPSQSVVYQSAAVPAVAPVVQPPTPQHEYSVRPVPSPSSVYQPAAAPPPSRQPQYTQQPSPPPPRQPQYTQQPSPPPPLAQQPQYIQRTVLPAVNHPQQFRVQPPSQPQPAYAMQQQIPQRAVPWIPPQIHVPYQQSQQPISRGCGGNHFNQRGGWRGWPSNPAPNYAPCPPSYGYGCNCGQCNPCGGNYCSQCSPCGQSSCSNACCQSCGCGGSGGCFSGQQCAPQCGGGYNPCQAANSCYEQQSCQITIIIQCCCPSRKGWCLQHRRRVRNKRSLEIMRDRR